MLHDLSHVSPDARTTRGMEPVADGADARNHEERGH